LADAEEGNEVEVEAEECDEEVVEEFEVELGRGLTTLLLWRLLSLP
jgi:hypothetical protein